MFQPNNPIDCKAITELAQPMKELEDEDLEKIIGGVNVYPFDASDDAASLKFSGKPVPLPPAKSKKPHSGGTVVSEGIVFNNE